MDNILFSRFWIRGRVYKICIVRKSKYVRIG